MHFDTAKPRTLRIVQIHALAFFSGGLLSVMLLANGALAEYTSPAFASWGAHATGSVTALVLLLLAATRRKQTWIGGAPVWAFSGGLVGALIVTVTTIAMNSDLSLAGTLAIGLAGQAVFGLVADRLGLFGLPVRKVRWQDIVALALVFAGSMAIILSVS